MAKRASLARDYGNTITTPRELYNWAVEQTDKNITKLRFEYISTEQYIEMSEELEELYNSTKTISGTQKFHSFVPITGDKVAAKRYSNSEDEPKIFNLIGKRKK